MGEKRARSDVRKAFDLEPRARVAAGVLGLLVIVDLVAMAIDLNYLSIINRVIDGERVPLADLNAADSRFNSSALAQLVLIALCALTFLLWYSRAYRNVIAMGVRAPRYGTRWAVGSWFVPFVNLVIPKNVTNDIYRGSDPEMAYGDPAFASRPISPLLNWWWALWLISGVLDRIAARSSSATANDLASSTQIYIASDVLNAIAGCLAIAVVMQITRRSEVRRARFGNLVQDQQGESEPREPSAASPPPPSAPTLPPPAPPSPPARPSGSFGPPGSNT